MALSLHAGQFQPSCNATALSSAPMSDLMAPTFPPQVPAMPYPSYYYPQQAPSQPLLLQPQQFTPTVLFHSSPLSSFGTPLPSESPATGADPAAPVEVNPCAEMAYLRALEMMKSSVFLQATPALPEYNLMFPSPDPAVNYSMPGFGPLAGDLPSGAGPTRRVRNHAYGVTHSPYPTPGPGHFGLGSPQPTSIFNPGLNLVGGGVSPPGAGDQPPPHSTANATNVGTPTADKSVKKRRGNLPKHVTAMLKSWLLEHMMHPYPTEEEKLTLARQTNLTLNQISNWFINARRRIIQPMLSQCTTPTTAATIESRAVASMAATVAHYAKPAGQSTAVSVPYTSATLGYGTVTAAPTSGASLTMDPAFAAGAAPPGGPDMRTVNVPKYKQRVYEQMTSTGLNGRLGSRDKANPVAQI
ncbi:Homeobox protein [Tieghemiomyces parasiticus]|uniref:Homeobox protein n=1 Tax=Tieghemiomyces parasiticus TaxID=78921 RepID=A0A9W8A8T0_9FUNG|nr:Homeobox protein [Tieghemiomyces parasiticus]